MNRLGLLAVLGMLGGCDAPAPQAADTPPSPQASAEPAPLATWPHDETSDAQAPQARASGVAKTPDAGSPPVGLRADLPLPADAALRESSAVFHVDYVFHAIDPMPVTRAPETNGAMSETLRRRWETTHWSVDFALSRMRMAFRGPTLFPESVELRGRSDRLGHLAYHKASSSYRPLPVGSLRTFFGEGRFDVAPPLAAELRSLGESQRALPRGLGPLSRPPARVEVKTQVATMTLELARAAEGFEVGPLLCRSLLDLVQARPDALECQPDEVPLRAEIRWSRNKGGMLLEAVTVSRRPDGLAADFAVPPKDSRHELRPWQPFTSRLLLQDAELGQLRSAPQPVEPVADAPSGLLLHNHRSEPLFVGLDGVTVAWVGAGDSLLVRGLQHGRYQAQWWSALDDYRQAPDVVVVPGVLEVGVEGK